MKAKQAKPTYWHEKSVAKNLREHSETVQGVLVRMDLREAASMIERMVEELQKIEQSDNK